jgi:hypothetical protein
VARHRDHHGRAASEEVAISVEAFDPIASTLALGSVAFDNKIDKQGQRRIWPDRAVVGPSSIPSLSDDVMLGTAWIDWPVDTRGWTPASTSSLVQHGCAAMPVPSATGDQASALAP